jgi:hypothetical protein
LLSNLNVFQIYGNNGGHTEYSHVWNVSNIVIRDVLLCHVRSYGKESAQ